MLSPIHLRTFIAVMNTGSFAVAARELGYTPSAVSQQIASLERSAHQVLFTRDARGIRPTPGAEHLLTEARTVLASLRSLDRIVSMMSTGEMGVLRVGSFPTASQRLIPGMLSELSAKCPELNVTIVEGEPPELLSLLGGNEIDVALAYRYDIVPSRGGSSLQRDDVLLERMLALIPAGHPLAERSELAPADLRDERWITTRKGTPAAELAMRVCADAGFEPNTLHQSNDYEVIRAFVNANLGVAIVPALAYRQSEDSVGIALKHPRAVRRVACVQVPELSHPGGAHLLRALRVTARRLSARNPLVSTFEWPDD